jgi:hypothetical protein
VAVKGENILPVLLHRVQTALINEPPDGTVFHTEGAQGTKDAGTQLRGKRDAIV